MNDGVWHHACVTWDGAQGELAFYTDGSLRKNSIAVRKLHTILPGGKLVFGHSQLSFGGTFNVSESFVGEIHGVNMWNEVFNCSQILNMSLAFRPEQGNVLSWVEALIQSSEGLETQMPSDYQGNID